MSGGLDLVTIVASSGSALVARLSTHPLDTLRVRIQTAQGSGRPRLSQVIPKPWTGLYAGLPIALAFNGSRLSIPGSACYLTCYEACKNGFAKYILTEDSSGKPPTLLQQAPLIVSAALAAEMISGAIWTPMDVLKQRLQTGRENTKSAPTLIKQIWRDEGYRGVWRGYFFSLAQFGPYVSIYWLLYESFKTRYIPGYVSTQGPSRLQPPPQHEFFSKTTLTYTACSIGACAISTITTNPVDIVQTRWQTSGGKITNDGLSTSKEGNIRDIVRHLWQEGGAKAFMRGTGVRVFYAVPANAIGMTTYESLKRYGRAWEAKRAEDRPGTQSS